MRLTRDMMFMTIAETVARRSTCRRLNVGAVLVDATHNIASIGYNGPPAGERHCYGVECGVPSCSRAIHAEKNAIDRTHQLEEYAPRVCTLYVTHSPCEHCFKYILTYPAIGRVVFMDEYRINEHLKADHGIKIEKITPSGYVTDFVTGRLIEGPEEV